MREIKLTRGQIALVDDEDFEYINQWKWCALPTKFGKYYAGRNENRTTVYMHRRILGLTDGNILCDHIDRNSLNNCRTNLRKGDFFLNNSNQPVKRTNISGYKGVSWCSQTRKWRVQVYSMNKRYCVGRFNTIEDAANAYAEVYNKLNKSIAA